MVSRSKISEATLDPLGRRRHGRAVPQVRACAVEGCAHNGSYRAPRDRSLTEYVWLCLEHVRDYNRQWNYYEGMTAEQMEAEIRRDTTWQRPTWKLGTLGARPAGGDWRDHVHDPFGFFHDDREAADAEANRQRRKASARSSGEETADEKALRVLDMELPITVLGLKARYKELVKRHHPDINPDDPGAEDRLKDIIEAYKTLLGGLNNVG